MEKLFYEIEKAEYIHADSGSLVRIYGWAFYDQSSIYHISVLIDGIPVEYHFGRFNQEYVVRRFAGYLSSRESAFVITIPVASDTGHIQITTDQNDTLFDGNIETLAKNRKESRLEHCIDSSLLRNDGKILVTGWAYSLSAATEVRLLNNQGEIVPAQVIRYSRQDLLDLGYTSEEYGPSGFHVIFSPDPSQMPYSLQISSDTFTIREICYRNENPYLKWIRDTVNGFHPKAMLRQSVSTINYVRIHGWKQYRNNRKIKSILPSEERYDQWFRRQAPSSDQLKEQQKTRFPYMPRISIVVAAYNTPIGYLDEMITSVLNQTYSNWQLCIADGSTDEKVKNHIQHKYSHENRIAYSYLNHNNGISGNTNEAIALADGDYIAFFDHDDLLTPDCLYEVVKSLQDEKNDVIYTDEDKMNDYTRMYMDPSLKPDYSPETLESFNYITHFTVIRRELVDEIGFLDSSCDGAQDYDYVLRACDRTRKIHHIPKVLYHWRMHPLSTAMDPTSKDYCYLAGKRALEKHLDRKNIKGSVSLAPYPLFGMYHVRYEVEGNPLISIIIPNMDHHEDLDQCLNSIATINTYQNIEILIVENNSRNSQTFAFYEKILHKFPNIRLLKYEGAFNFSAINNMAARQAKGEYLLFLNNDTKLIQPDSISCMLGYAQRKEIGVVGAKLLYSDNTIQHAGIVVGHHGHAGLAFLTMPSDQPTPSLRGNVTSNWSAVTGACMMISHHLFEQVGGFDEELAVAFNDIDLCMKVQQINKRVVCTPLALWYHYESRSRGLDQSGSRKKRYEKEKAYFSQKWPMMEEGNDPYHNPNYQGEVPFLIDLDH